MTPTAQKSCGVIPSCPGLLSSKWLKRSYGVDACVGIRPGEPPLYRVTDSKFHVFVLFRNAA